MSQGRTEFSLFMLCLYIYIVFIYLYVLISLGQADTEVYQLEGSVLSPGANNLYMSYEICAFMRVGTKSLDIVRIIIYCNHNLLMTNYQPKML